MEEGAKSICLLSRGGRPPSEARVSEFPAQIVGATTLGLAAGAPKALEEVEEFEEVK